MRLATEVAILARIGSAIILLPSLQPIDPELRRSECPIVA